jgi:hypothetical protein
MDLLEQKLSQNAMKRDRIQLKLLLLKATSSSCSYLQKDSCNFSPNPAKTATSSKPIPTKKQL